MLVSDAAEQAATKLWQMFQGENGLVDLDKLCKYFHIKVTYTPDVRDARGLLVREDECKNPKVYINSTLPIYDQRFMLAHMIGHFIEMETIQKSSTYSFRC